jgi:hypothetical protein
MAGDRRIERHDEQRGLRMDPTKPGEASAMGKARRSGGVGS